MDLPTINSAGLGSTLETILQTIGTGKYEEPLWSLRQTKDRIYLDIVWSKTPAKIGSHGGNKAVVGSGPRSVKTPDTIPNNHPVATDNATKVKRKRKSPSTRKRDRERLLKWKASKRERAIAKVWELVANPLTSSVPTDSVESGTTNSEVIPHIPSAADDGEAAGCTGQARTQQATTTTSDSPSLHAASDDREATGCTDKIGIQPAITTATIPDWRKDFLQLCPGLPSSGPDNPACWNCLQPEQQTTGLKKCTQCSQAQYCSRECQREHWKQNHSQYCKKILEWHRTYNRRHKTLESSTNTVDNPST